MEKVNYTFIHSMKTVLSFLLLIGLISFTTEVAAQGDDCASAVAQVAATGIVANGPSAGAGAALGCFTTGATNSDWYSFTATACGTIDVTSTNDPNTTDTRLSIYSGTCAGLTCVASDDDGGTGFTSTVTGLSVYAGKTYFIEWDDRWSTSGFEWDLTFTASDLPPMLTDLSNMGCNVTVEFMSCAATADIEVCPTGVASGGAGCVSFAGVSSPHTFDACAANFTGAYTVTATDVGGASNILSAIAPINCSVNTLHSAAPVFSENFDALAITNNGNGTWNVRSAAPTSGNGPLAANSAPNYLYFEASGTNGPAAFPIGTVNLNTASEAELSFFWHFATDGQNQTGNFVELEVSTDGGTTWVNLNTFQPGTPALEGDAFVAFSTSLNAFIGMTIDLQLVGNDGAGFVDFAIDDITVQACVDCVGPNAPTFTSTPANLNVGTDSDICGANVTVVAPVATDDCPVAGLTITNDFNGTADASGVYPTGVNTVTWTVTDGIGNSITHVQTITVTDDDAPTVSCPANQTINLGAGDCTSTVSYVASATDNCTSSVGSVATITAGGNGGNVGGAVYFNVTNGTGSPMEITSFDMSISANTMVDVYTSATYVGNAGNAGAWTLAGQADATAGAVGVGVATPALTSITIQPGTTGIALHALNASHNYTNGTGANQSFTDGSLTLDLGSASNTLFGGTFDPRVFNGGVSYLLDLDPVGVQTAGLPSGSAFPIGTTTNTFTFTDAAGNVSTCSFDVTVNEFANPISSIACNDNVQVSVDENCQAVVGADMILEGGPYGCYDNYTVSINGGNNIINVSMIGLTLPVTVTDAAGNSCWGTITIEDKIAPSIVCFDQVIACTDPIPTEPAPAGTADAVPFLGGQGVDILDNDIATITIPVNAPGNAVVTDINVSIDLTHSWVGDLVIDVVSPSGTSINVWNGFCGNAVPGLNFILDDEGADAPACADYNAGNNVMLAGLTPLPALSSLDGELAGGDWVITIEDTFGADEGVINAVGVEVTYDAAQVTPGDACGTVTTTSTETVVENGCNSAYGQTITRLYTTTDASGNSSTCTQVINVERAAIADLTLPADVNLNCTTTCTNVVGPVEVLATDVNAVWSNDPTNHNYNPDPSLEGKLLTGEPEGAGCFNIDFTRDNDIIIDICDGSYKVLRKWILADWCTSEVVEHVQIIKVLDTTAPVVENPGTITVGTTSNACAGNVFLPTLIATDDCSSVMDATFSLGGAAIANGILTNAPSGNHTIDYAVADGCGNVATGSFTLVVVDNIAPLAICDEFTQIGIGSDGTSFVPAAVFDDGSYDNCGIVTMDVRRMTDPCHFPPQLGWKSAAEFCCGDVGTTVDVEFRVTDAAGNTNSCMVQVLIEDKIAPQVICPPAKTINCTDDFTDTNLTGQALAFDNCSTVTPTFVDNANINDCGEGTVTRIWSVTDDSGNSASCVQFITLTNADPFFICDTKDRTTFALPMANGGCGIGHATDDDVEWPADIELTTCGLGLEPADLEASYPLDARPIVSEDACGTIGVTKEDLTLPIQGDACIKVIRTWTIIDWCQYDVTNPTGGGRWDYVQVIKVVNSQAPNVNCGNSDSYIQNFEENCGGTYVNLFIDADDDCTDQADLTYSYTVENGNGTVVQTGNTNNASDAFNNGSYKVTWSVADGCGNTQVCVHDFEVVDAKKPTPVCLNGLATVIMPSASAVTIWATDFESGSSFDNCTPYSGLQFSFSSDVTNTNMTFTCADITAGNAVPVEIWVTDGSGNQDFCLTYILVQDPNGVCPPIVTSAVSGAIQTEDGDEVEDVTISLVGSNEAPIVTGANGAFNFPNMAGTSYIVTPEKVMNPLNGVTTFDLVLISKHILGTQALASPYKIIAADANASNTVTTFDIVTLRRLILQIDTDFVNNNSWRFVASDYVFADATNPFAEVFPETVNLATSNATNFVGVKVGDVNGSASPNSLLGTDTRTFNGDLVFQLEDKQVQAGEEFTVDFNAKDFNNTLGYQFTLGFDNAEFVDVATNLTNLDEANFGFAMLEEGIITTSWNNHTAVNVEDNATVFSLTFTATETANISEIVNINSRYTQTEAYNGSDLYNVALAFNGQVATADFKLYQNTPNPFKDVTSIGFNLPTAATATLKVYDVSGKVLMVQEVEGAKGYNSVEINRGQLSATGVLYYQVETADHTATLKMILVD